MEQEAPQNGAVIGGRFRVIRVLGKGGMGVVVAARNLVTGKQVAIKWMHAAAAAHPDAVQRLIQEAAASARIRHPNVVDVYDIIQDDTGVFLVMEYLRGEPLTRMLERGGMPVSELLSVLIGAMRGVSAAHKAGVVHRDIKPDNIFLIQGGDSQHCIPKVLDFGISKITDSVGPSLTQTGTALGTPMYMSCEQLRNARDVDGRTDIYAVGVILYEAVTGQSPFPGESFAEVVAKIMTTDPPTPKSLSEHLPDALDEVIRRAMAKDREDRFPSMDEFIRALSPFATTPKFQLQIAEEDERSAPPADPSMVTALTPVARSAFAHASTIDQTRIHPQPSQPVFAPAGMHSARPARRDHSGMVLSLGVPPPAGVNPHLARGDDTDSSRQAHRTLDPRTTTHGERPRHMGIIGVLVAAAVAVGVGALLLPAQEERQDGRAVTAAGSGLSGPAPVAPKDADAQDNPPAGTQAPTRYSLPTGIDPEAQATQAPVATGRADPASREAGPRETTANPAPGPQAPAREAHVGAHLRPQRRPRSQLEHKPDPPAAPDAQEAPAEQPPPGMPPAPPPPEPTPSEEALPDLSEVPGVEPEPDAPSEEPTELEPVELPPESEPAAPDDEGTEQEKPNTRWRAGELHRDEF